MMPKKPTRQKRKPVGLSIGDALLERARQCVEAFDYDSFSSLVREGLKEKIDRLESECRANLEAAEQAEQLGAEKIACALKKKKCRA
jgi:Arc/MetJ-type ribon-helix-helix transcriptional regulator